MLPMAQSPPPPELRVLVALVRHGDRTPKQKLKMIVRLRPPHPFLPYVAPHFSHISHFNLCFSGTSGSSHSSTRWGSAPSRRSSSSGQSSCSRCWRKKNKCLGYGKTQSESGRPHVGEMGSSLFFSAAELSAGIWENTERERAPTYGRSGVLPFYFLSGARSRHGDARCARAVCRTPISPICQTPFLPYVRNLVPPQRRTDHSDHSSDADLDGVAVDKLRQLKQVLSMQPFSGINRKIQVN